MKGWQWRKRKMKRRQGGGRGRGLIVYVSLRGEAGITNDMSVLCGDSPSSSSFCLCHAIHDHHHHHLMSLQPKEMVLLLFQMAVKMTIPSLRDSWHVGE